MPETLFILAARKSVYLIFSTYLCEVFVVVKVKLTIIDDADHYSITGDVIAPNWHHIQVKPTGVVLALCKLNTHPHTTLLSQLEKVDCNEWLIFLTSIQMHHFLTSRFRPLLYPFCASAKQAVNT